MQDAILFSYLVIQLPGLPVSWFNTNNLLSN